MSQIDELRVVPMDLFLQDQKRQDDDLRQSRTEMANQMGSIVTEIKGLRADIQTLANSDLAQAAVQMHDSEVRLTRREKMLAVVAVLALAVPLVTSVILRVVFGV